jgi:polyhydroxyalkanoate synthesis regulator phasin
MQHADLLERRIKGLEDENAARKDEIESLNSRIDGLEGEIAMIPAR